MDKELPISPWPEWKIVSKIGEGSFGRVYKAQRTEKGRSFYSAIKIITIPASKGELDSVRSESGDEKSVRGYFENLVEECIQEVSTMEYFRGNSHIVSVEDYKVMEYLDEIGWDIFIRMEYLTSFMEYYAGKNLTEKEAREKRLAVYAEKIQETVLNKSAETIRLLVEERHNQKMTQQELSDITGIQPSNLARFESGGRVPTLIVLEKYANALGKHIEIKICDN